MAEIEVGPSAKADLAKIAAHLRIHVGDRAADAFEAGVGAVLKRLALSPQTGSPRPGLGTGARSAAVGSYLILHRYDRAADAVFVLRVPHGRRRLALDAP